MLNVLILLQYVLQYDQLCTSYTVAQDFFTGNLDYMR